MIAQLSNNLLTLDELSQLVQGCVGETLEVRLSDEWKELAATAVFSNGALTRDVVVSGERITIPWELLLEDSRMLTLSFHGAAADGDVIQTNIASLGRIKKSHSPSGQEPDVPTPARADQIQAIAGQALAAAAAVQASAAAGAFDGVSPTVSVETIPGGYSVTVTDRDGSHAFTVRDGEDADALTIDDALSPDSENAVQNKVIQAALDQKADRSELVQVDGAIKPNSENPVQNKVIYQLYLQMGQNYNTLHDELDRMFIAEFNHGLYGDTKFSDVKQAYSDGKYLLCLDSYSGVMFPLLMHQEADAETDVVESFIFGGVSGDEFVRLTCSNVIDNGDWPPPEVWTRTLALLPQPAATLPRMDGTAAIGHGTEYAFANHVHPSDTSKSDKLTEVTVSAAGAVTQALDAGKIYHFTGDFTALTITLNAPANGQLAQYHFDFLSGATAPTLTMPNTVTMPDSFAVEASKRYEVDVLNNYGTVMAWAVS